MYNSSNVFRKQVAAALSPQLSEEYKTRSMGVREGDTVAIMNGSFAGVEGKIQRVDTKKLSLYVEGITREKTDGTSKLVPIHPSNVVIRSLNLDDKRRKEILKRKSAAKAGASAEKEAAKPQKKSTRRKKSQEDVVAEAKE